MFSFESVFVQLFLYAVAVQCGALIGTANFKMTKLEMCDPSKDYPIKMQGTIRDGDNNVQYFTATSDFKVPFGENSDYNVTVDMKKSKDQKSFKPVFNLYDENACDAIKKYLGDFIVEMQKSAGIEPGTCPVPKGSYSMKDHQLDFKKIAFQSVPQGILRAKHVIRDLTTKEELMCLIVDVENFPK